ncbi:hypothetical protein [Bergeriella denitrificans]|nr:hypothetical protein [Bergeriella denitrificans]
MKPLLPKLLIPAAALLLAACGAQTEQPAASAPQAASASAAPLAASDTAASAPDAAASDVAASAAEPQQPGGTLAEQSRAAWQRYRCEDGGRIEVRYYRSNAGPAAQVRFQGAVFTAPYSPELSDEDLTAFSNGNETWTIGNEFGQDFYREANGFLVRHEQMESADGDQIVDNLLVQGCAPEAGQP